MCLLIQDKIALYGFSPGLFFCAGVSSSVILFIVVDVQWKQWERKLRIRGKKKTLDQSALAKLALVQRQLALKIRNKAVPLCKLFL